MIHYCNSTQVSRHLCSVLISHHLSLYVLNQLGRSGLAWHVKQSCLPSVPWYPAESFIWFSETRMHRARMVPPNPWSKPGYYHINTYCFTNRLWWNFLFRLRLQIVIDKSADSFLDWYVLNVIKWWSSSNFLPSSCSCSLSFFLNDKSNVL